MSYEQVNGCERYLTSKQLAQRWGISEGTLRNYRWRGCGPAYVVLNGRTVRYSVSGVERYEQARVVRGGSA